MLPPFAVAHHPRRIDDQVDGGLAGPDRCGDSLARKILGAKGVDLSVPRRHQLDQFSPCRSLRRFDMPIAARSDSGGV